MSNSCEKMDDEGIVILSQSLEKLLSLKDLFLNFNESLEKMNRNK